ncbi:MAG: Tim44 domain-containing protein, partial [Rhodospirillaceae bacterium]|nr:Tim44 domain-containing protein [Rhodospirillaceae bacterium]
MDILIFAVVAGVIFFKLFSVLGRKTGHEQPPPMPMADAAG